ncbi:hypothetical protein WA1_44440 [Scytonema hofmannii PCC 7110]|uniref:Uncharacterized protein n=1 Tax=Scytonema hofmannii PCC 7110 TaxID=128403 RepID=A0A139WWB0_9CYAN|nr:hypothetical protein [Scytonema hofmannii]KYC36731.1 hypothetical protein WA1_44440 [Scytonema hofmannii PCC 7110]
MQLLKQENKKTNILPLLAVATFGLNLLALLVLMFHGSMLQQLNRRNTTQSLVQLADGSAITADPKQNLERNPETIRRFVGETMTLMLTWSQKQPPRTVWQLSSQLLAGNARQRFELEVDKLIPENQAGNINKGTESVLVVQRISEPTKIESENGKWKVEIIGNHIVFTSSDPLGETTPFRKQILVQAIDEQATSLPKVPLPLDLAVHRLGEAKLEIYNICEITDNKCS